jgi:hypothetical protein
MSAAPDTAKQWNCDRCGVSVRQMNGEQSELPGGWANSDEGQYCLRCRRERAADAALDSAADESSHEARARLRRTALLEFEVKRTPDRSNGEIARACRSSVPAVAEARRRLDLAEPAKPSGQARG